MKNTESSIISFDEKAVIISLFFNKDLNYPFHLNHSKSKPVIAHTYPDYEFNSSETVIPGALTLTGLERYLVDLDKHDDLIAGFITSFPKPAVLKNREIDIKYHLKPMQRMGATLLYNIHSANSAHPEKRDSGEFAEKNIKGNVFIYDKSKELRTEIDVNGVDYDDSKKEQKLRDITMQKNLILMNEPDKPEQKIFDLESLLGKKLKEKYITDTDGKKRMVIPEVKGLISGKKPVIVLDDAYDDLKGVYLRNNRIHGSETYEFDYGNLDKGMLGAFCQSIGISEEDYTSKYGEYLCPSLCSALFIPAYGNFVKREEKKWIKDAKEKLNAESEDELQVSGVFARQSLVSDLRHMPKIGSDITVFVNYQSAPKQRLRKGNYMIISTVSASIFDEHGRPAIAGSASFLGYISKKEKET